MTEVIRILRREHGNILTLVKTLERQIAAFDQANEPDYGLVEGIVDYFLSFPDLYHHPKENMVFAKLQERDPAAAEEIGDLQCEHEEIASRTRDFAAAVRTVMDEHHLPRETVERCAREFIGMQKEHMEKEERLFFPAALKALTPEDWSELEEKMTDQDDPLFGDRVGERYEALHASIVKWEREDPQG